MEILNIGPLELIVVLLIMFFLLGPKGMIQTAQKIGSWIRGFVRSPMWREIMGYSQEIRELPKKIMDESGLQEALDDVQQTTKQTASELNATVNEAVQAARVTEAEHVKIDVSAKSEPVPEPVKPKSEVELLAERVRAVNAEKEQALADTAAAESEEQSASEEASIETPTTVETAIDKVVPAPRKPRGRPKKSAAVVETLDAEVVVESLPIGADLAIADPGLEISSAGLAIQDDSIQVTQPEGSSTDPAPIRKPRASRAKKVEPIQTDGEAVLTELDAVPVVQEPAMPTQSEGLAGTTKVRKSTKRAESESIIAGTAEPTDTEAAVMPAEQLVSEAADDGAVKRKAGRPRKVRTEDAGAPTE
jgi:Sec-independent protein translocase protein TatA